MAAELPQLLVADAAEWRDWLTSNHADAPGVWLVLTKKGGTTTTLTYAEAVEEALCFGWIDGQGAKRDAESSLQRMTPRRPRSPWSKVNVERAERLEREGRMHDAGRAQVAAAKADGRWDKAYAGPATSEVPADLLAAIAEAPAAQAWFDVLTSTNRFALTYRLNSVKREETRRRKIAEFVDKLSRGELPHPQKRRPEGQAPE